MIFFATIVANIYWYVGYDDPYEAYETIKNKKQIKNQNIGLELDIKKGLCLKNKKENGFLFLLPIPEIRASLAMSGKNGKDSEVCIEYLFPDKKIKDLLKDRDLVGGGKVQVITERYRQEK